MKKTIGIGMFLLGLVIWAVVISFLIELPLASILNTEDYLPASITVWIKTLIGIVAIFISVLIGCKRYIVPASIFWLSFWIAFIYFILGLLNLIALQLMLGPLISGSNKVLAFVSVQSIIPAVISAVLAGGATYLALRLFSQSNSFSITQ
ncbi:MAG: hypothetical protein Q8L01_02275 [Candidatus Woesebacteria bacterium]|nr:hypothetical protein [Candidatus Woesebacteria bacterium]